MTDERIYNEIVEFRKTFRHRKDGDVGFVKAFVKAVNSSPDKADIINFLLNELAKSKYYEEPPYALYYGINDSDFGQRIFDTYLNVSKDKNDKWKEQVIYILLDLKFEATEEFYSSFLDNYLLENKDHSLCLLNKFLTSNINPEAAIDYYNSFFSEYLLEDNLVSHNIVNGICSPFKFLIRNQFLAKQLIDKTLKNNNKVGQKLILDFLNYVESDYAVHHFKQESLESIKEILGSYPLN